MSWEVLAANFEILGPVAKVKVPIAGNWKATRRRPTVIGGDPSSLQTWAFWVLFSLPTKGERWHVPERKNMDIHAGRGLLTTPPIFCTSPRSL